MTNKIQKGGRETYFNTGAAIASGAVVGPFGTNDRFGVAVTDIAATTGSGTIETAGIKKLAATAADAWAHGDKLYWDPATGKLTDVAGALKEIGTAMEAKAATVTTAEVLINNTPLPD